MKLKLTNKKAEIKNIEEAEVVEVGTSAEAMPVEEVDEAEVVEIGTSAEAAVLVPEEVSNVIEIDKLTDRELIEETYFAVLELIKKFGTAPVAKKVPGEKAERKNNKNKMTSAEKKDVKEKLLAGGPYTKEVLSSWKRRELVMYASVLELGKAKAFGVGTPELVTNIVAGQKKKK